MPASAEKSCAGIALVSTGKEALSESIKKNLRIQESILAAVLGRFDEAAPLSTSGPRVSFSQTGPEQEVRDSMALIV